jgi:ComF family protein
MTDEPLARSIWNLKYRNLPGLADPLAAWLADTVCNHPTLPSLDDHVIVPVPLHPYKLSERGYNQAELLANALGRILAIPVVTDVLIRVRNTASQVERATRAERFANASGAFALAHPESLEGKPILLVDDVSTTGATLASAAKPLLETGASVTGLVLARG